MFDVAIIMGSDSDLEVMQDAAKFLDLMGISYEMKILSVHRTPEKAMEYAMVPTVPVIGIPIHTKTLSGLDSLYSIVQMPSRYSCCNSCY